MTNITRLQVFEPLHGVETEPSWHMHPRQTPTLRGPLMIDVFVPAIAALLSS